MIDVMRLTSTLVKGQGESTVSETHGDHLDAARIVDILHLTLWQHLITGK